MGEPGKANKANLIKINDRDPAEALAIRSKGGRTVTPNRKISATLRSIKENGITDARMNQLITLMEDPGASSFHILQKIELFANDPMIPKTDRMRLIKNLTEWHRIHHGAKDTATVNVQINVMTPEKRQAELKRILEREDKQ